MTDIGGEYFYTCKWFRWINKIEIMLKDGYKKLPKKKNSFLYSNKIIITTKEARKIMGKDDSDKISDEDLARLIGLMHKIADDLMDIKIVPENKMVV